MKCSCKPKLKCTNCMYVQNIRILNTQYGYYCILSIFIVTHSMPLIPLLLSLTSHHWLLLSFPYPSFLIPHPSSYCIYIIPHHFSLYLIPPRSSLSSHLSSLALLPRPLNPPPSTSTLIHPSSTLNPQPSTFSLNAQPSNPLPSTLNFQPSTFISSFNPPTFNPQPSNVNTQPLTFNYRPSTLDLQLSTFNSRP